MYKEINFDLKTTEDRIGDKVNYWYVVALVALFILTTFGN